MTSSLRLHNKLVENWEQNPELPACNLMLLQWHFFSDWLKQLFSLIITWDVLLISERKEGRGEKQKESESERERHWCERWETSIYYLPFTPQPGIKPAIFLVHRMTFQPTKPPGQGEIVLYSFICPPSTECQSCITHYARLQDDREQTLSNREQKF